MRDTISRRHALAVLAASGLAIPLGARSQSWPARPVRVVVPSVAGATVDNLARNVSTTLAERWGVPVVVDNKPGASSIIGSDAVAKAPADGYTILFAAVTLVQIPHLFRKLPFDAMTSFEPIAQTG
ncbi:MAG: tripartite tricarboxylate transporter substrate binding protein, partial [Comamonadaceae bacterium]